MALLTVLLTRLRDERGGFEIASSMAIAAFGIVAAVAIFALLTDLGTDVVDYMRGLIIQ